MAKKLNKIERENWLRHRKQGCSNIHRAKVNELNIYPNNTYEHEKAKFDKAYELLSMGHKILTEAEEISTGERVDLVDITAGERYEFETDPKRAARFIGRPINVIPVGWNFENKKWKRLVEAKK